MFKLGEWLIRKWNATNKKMVESTKQLDELGISKVELHSEWKEQKQQQLKPLARKHLN
jgi:predicted Ser/Thr protein kinase